MGLSDIDGYIDQLCKVVSSLVFDRYKYYKILIQIDKDVKLNVEIVCRNLNYVYDR